MTKIFDITILNNVEGGTQAIPLAEFMDVSSFNFFQRKSVSEFMSFTSKLVAQKTKKGQRQSVQQQEYMCHCFCRSDSLAAICITDNEYPSRIVFTLLSKLLEDFSKMNPLWSEYAAIQTSPDTSKFPELESWFKKFQDPQEADSLCRVQKELDDTKVVLHQTLEGLLNRGEKLDDLVARSDMLSQSSKAFYTTARKTNSWCCTIM